LAYFATWESSWLQATQGKLLFGLKVTGEDGKRVSRTHGLAKALAQFGFLLFAGLIATVPAGIASHFLYDSMHMWTGWAPFLVFGAVDLVLIAVLTCLPLIGGRTVLDLVARKQIVLASDLAKMPAPGKKEGARSILRFVWDFSTALLSIVLCGLVFITLMGGLYSGGDYCARWWQSTGPTLARVEEGIRLQNAGDAEAARVQFDQARSSSKLAVYPYLMGHGASNLFLPLPQLSLYFAEREIAVGEPAFQAGAYRYRAEALEMLGRKEEAMAAYKKILAPETGGADDNLKGLAREGLKRLQ
ncbi:MAG: RDD family protein, partial [Candidatus Obscuribacterales bacterium]